MRPHLAPRTAPLLALTLRFALVLAGQKMDVRKLEFADGTFDVVVDKGTLDSVLVSCPGDF